MRFIGWSAMRESIIPQIVFEIEAILSTFERAARSLQHFHREAAPIATPGLQSRLAAGGVTHFFFVFLLI